MAALGPLPGGAGLGHRPGGLQRRWLRLGVLSLRPCPPPGVPLERGRHGGDLRPAAAHMPRPGPLERARPDPQGADVRPDGLAGQPRRGRQGVLVVPRCHPNRVLPAMALPLPADTISLRGPTGREPGPQPPRPRVRAGRHRHLRRGPVLGSRGGMGQSRSGRSPVAHHRAQRGPRRGDNRRAAHHVVPQRLVMGRRPCQAHDHPGRGRHHGRGRRVGDPRGRASGTRDPGARGPRAQRSAVLRQRDQRGGAVAGGCQPGLPQGRHRRPRDHRRSNGQSRHEGHEGRAAVPPERARGRRGDRPAPLLATAVGRCWRATNGHGRSPGPAVRPDPRPPARRSRRVLRRPGAGRGHAPTSEP